VLHPARPCTEERREPREGGLVVGRELVAREPSQLGDVVGRRRLARCDRRFPHEVEDRDRAVVSTVAVEEEPEERPHVDFDRGFLEKLAMQGFERIFSFLEESAEGVPLSRVRLERPAGEEQVAGVVDDERCGCGNRVCVLDEAARRAPHMPVGVDELPSAPRTEAPAGEDSHEGTVPAVSPRHVPASVTELARVGLFGALPGETLAALAERMTREEVASGTVILEEGQPGDRFFVLLSGIAGVAQSSIGYRGVLRAGDYFGEVALAMGVPRTATITAMTPCVVASCDAAAFEALVRPLFSDD